MLNCELKFRHGAWEGKIDGTLRVELGHFLGEETEAGDKLYANAHGVRVRRLETAHGTFYAKHFLVEGQKQNFIHHMIEFFCGGIVERIARIHQRIQQSQTGEVAEVVLIAHNQVGEQLLVTRELTAPSVQAILKQLTATGDAEGRRNYLIRVMKALRKFHCAGFIHGDCHPGNLLLPLKENLQGDLLGFLDNDRTMHFWFPLRYLEERRNLIQFFAHLYPMEAQEDREEIKALLCQYGGWGIRWGLLGKIHRRRQKLLQEKTAQQAKA